MSTTTATRIVPYHECGPERILHVGDVVGTAEAASGTMRTGPWLRGPDGVPRPGTLGVLADVVWGGAAVACAPPEAWGVSTELQVSLGAPLPDDGSVLSASGTVVHHDEHGALATGTVTTPDGRVVACGTQRTRFAPLAAQARPLDEEPASEAGRSGFADRFGFELAADGAETSFLATETVSNPGGHLHGGVLFCACELTASAAAAAGRPGLAPTSLTVLYLRRAQLGERIRCEPEVAHRGMTAAAVLVRCVRPDGKVCALATVNFGPVGRSNG